MKLSLTFGALVLAAMTFTACATQPTNSADAARTAKAEQIANRMNRH